VRDEKLERILKNPPKVTDGEVIVHKNKVPFGHKPLAELGGVAQAEPQTLADLCARYELEMNPDSVPGLIQRFDLRFPRRADLVRRDQVAVRAGRRNRPVRQARAKSRTAAPEKTPRAPMETEAASACDVPTPEAARAAVPAPAWVAAPAGPIGSAAAAAPAQRNSSASGNE
jgi:hypothetical protein